MSATQKAAEQTKAERRKAAKTQRREAKVEAKEKGKVYAVAKRDNFRRENGGVVLKESELDEQEEQLHQEQVALLDKIYRDALARKVNRLASQRIQAAAEFEKKIALVHKQIARQANRRKAFRRRLLLDGFYSDIIRTKRKKKANTTVAVSREQKIEAIVTVKIESGQSVVVAVKNLHLKRTEIGPQVLILARTEQLVSASFPLTPANSSFKPEFTWTVSADYTHSFSTNFDLTTMSTYDGNNADLRANNDDSNKGFFVWRPSRGYNIMIDDQPVARYTLIDEGGQAISYSFSDNTEVRYDFVDNTSYGAGAGAFSYSIPVEESQQKKTPQEQMADLEEVAAEVERVKGVYNEGFMSESDFVREMTRLSHDKWSLEDRQFEQSLLTQIAHLKLQLINEQAGKENASGAAQPDGPAAGSKARHRKSRANKSAEKKTQKGNSAVENGIPDETNKRNALYIEKNESQNRLAVLARVLAYLNRYPKPDAGDDKGNLSASNFLTSSDDEQRGEVEGDEDGYFLDRPKGETRNIKQKRYRRKKKTKTSTLYHPTEIFILFATFELFPPVTLADVPQIITSVNQLQEKEQATIARANAELERLAKEDEQEAVRSFQSSLQTLPPPAPAQTFQPSPDVRPTPDTSTIASDDASSTTGSSRRVRFSAIKSDRNDEERSVSDTTSQWDSKSTVLSEDAGDDAGDDADDDPDAEDEDGPDAFDSLFD